MEKIRENDVVALVTPRPEIGLERGEVGNVVQVFDQTPDHPNGFIVEFLDDVGGVRAEADIIDPSEVVKLKLTPKGTLEEWLGNSSVIVIVFTDIIGSTALGHELGESWLDLLNTHFLTARKISNEYDGHEIKVMGDSYMVAFRNAVQAFDFALAFQRNTGDERIRIRAGVHAGTAKIIDNDILGLNDDILGIMLNCTPSVEKSTLRSWLFISNEAKHFIEREQSNRYSWLDFTSEVCRFEGASRSWSFWIVSGHGSGSHVR